MRFGLGVAGDWWEAVVKVDIDGGAGFALAVGPKGVDVFVLGEADGLQLSLEHVGNGASESGFYIAADYGGDEAREGGVEKRKRLAGSRGAILNGNIIPQL